jgi:hypothetical protein
MRREDMLRDWLAEIDVDNCDEIFGEIDDLRAKLLLCKQGVPDTSRCANCGQLFSKGFSGCAVNGRRYYHYPACPVNLTAAR